MTPITLRFLAIALSLLPLVCSAARQKNIESVTPRVGQQGTTVEVLLMGLSISDPREIIFETPGITVIELKEKTLLKPKNIAGGPRQDVTCKFVIAPNCPLGEHSFRLLTGTELSGLTTFNVSRFHCTDEAEVRSQPSNDTLETAEKISLNTTIRGLIDGGSNDDHDLYRIAVAKGQRLSVEVDSVRIADENYGDSEFDLQVRILNAEGKEIAQNDDNDFALQDPVISTVMDYDGFAYVEVSRSVFVKRASEYAIHVGDFARPLLAFPPGGKAGETVSVTLIGDGEGDYTEEISIPEKSGTFGLDVGANHPVRLRSSNYPNLMESEGQSPTAVANIPVAINGRLSKKGERDDYRLSVRKGERYRLRIYAFSLGSSIDAAMQIREIEGDKNSDPIVEVDDCTIPDRDIFGTKYRAGIGVGETIDPSTIWKADRDGDVIVRIFDNSGREGRDGIYRLEIEPVRTLVVPTLSTATNDGTESTRVTGLAIPSGNQWSVNITLPKGQFNDPEKPFRLVAHDLPKGVTMFSPPVVPGNNLWPVLFKAAPGSEVRGTTFTIGAEYLDPPKEKIESFNQQNVPFVNHSGGNAWKRVATERFFIGVTEPAPFSIELEEKEIHLIREATRKVPIKVTRHGDFAGPLLINVGFVDGAIVKSPEFVIPAGATSAEIELTATKSAPLDTLPLVITASNTNDIFDPYLGIGHIRVCSDIAKLKVTDPYLKLTAEPQSIRRNGSGELVWKVEQILPFEGEAKLEILGLPKGVTSVKSPTVTSSDSEAVFHLDATDEALLGSNPGLQCEVTYLIGDSTIKQITGKASLRIDPVGE